MKNRASRIIAFVLFLCFTTGQIIVFSHSHVLYSKISTSKHSSASGNDESCKICQLNHNTTPLLSTDLHNAVIYGTAYRHQQILTLSYQSISLVLAATRGPPVV